MSWRLRFTNQARKDAVKLEAAGLRPKAEALLDVLRDDPFQRMPPFEKLVGDLRGAYSRRISLQHRLVYEVVPDARTVKVLRMWTHYEQAPRSGRGRPYILVPPRPKGPVARLRVPCRHEATWARKSGGHGTAGAVGGGVCFGRPRSRGALRGLGEAAFGLVSEPVAYVESLDGVVAADLEGFLLHWDFVPPAGTLLRMLEGSSIVVLARDAESSRVCGYVAALTDHVVCGYVSAIEVRPEFRKRGIGTELLRRATERLNVYGIYLACAPAMIPYYESAGFARVAAMSKRRWPVADGGQAHHGDGTWGRGLYDKYRGTTWVLLHLSEVGPTMVVEPVQRGVERLVETARPVQTMGGERGLPFRDLLDGAQSRTCGAHAASVERLAPAAELRRAHDAT